MVCDEMAKQSRTTPLSSESVDVAAQWVPVASLRVWAKNPDPPSKKDVRELARSIRRFGFGEPIVARKENGEIIAGHARRLAALRLKMTSVPVRYLDLPEGEAHALALADNKIASNRKRDWDGGDVAAVIEDLEAAGVDLEDGTGFAADEIDDILEEEEPLDEVGENGNASAKEVPERFVVQVECSDEPSQVELLTRLEGEGFKVRALVS